VTKVLVIEDNSVTGERLCDLIREKGWEAEWAANGEAALTKLPVVCPDVAVLDYGLTDISGDVVLTALLAAVPHVIIFSAEDLSRLREVHAAHPYLRILKKPMEPADVLAAIEETANIKV
jgi:DNA-binding response OmpR family regulator